ncbi:MAG: SDR family NAD(P)-dependent oxidoreductase [Anaerolineales bacterium]|nr:SDR family NAD(P)-dependent oxidoreductase [Anaerolineales bacterium]
MREPQKTYVRRPPSHSCRRLGCAERLSLACKSCSGLANDLVKRLNKALAGKKDLDDIEQISEFVHEQRDRLDILINNAGVCLDGDQDITEIDLEGLDETLEVNFYEPSRLTRAFLPLVKKNNDGRVVNISSVW